MINITDKSKCCGCSACGQICPKQCINFEEDNEGFLYPKINSSDCIQCNLCEKVCPIITSQNSNVPLKVFAFKHKDIHTREQSSSGGFFIAVAEKILSENGIIFGAAFDQNWEVKHRYIDNIADITHLMRSKYVQSKIGKAYKDAETFLKQGRKVLFTGTPCQIAGLYRYLHKKYINLVTLDFICHGVPSPKVWRSYLDEEIIKQHSSRTQNTNTKINSINFREKGSNKYTWEKFGFVISGICNGKEKILLSSKFNENPYMKGFLANIYLRPSCYNCQFKESRSNSDITMADFWGIKTEAPLFYDNSGISCVIINSKTGLNNLPEGEFQDSNIEIVKKLNHAYQESVKCPSNRNLFFTLLNSSHSVEHSVNKCTHIPIYKRVYKKISGKITKIFNKQ